MSLQNRGIRRGATARPNPCRARGFPRRGDLGKIAFGHFIDGKVSAVLGTHTHVQTADEEVLPRGTAYITDVGMTGPHDSVIGSKKGPAIVRFMTQMPLRFEPAEKKIKFCGALLDIDERTGRAQHIERLRLEMEG